MLLSYATGVVAADSAVFVDFDTLPSTGASLSQTLDFVLGEGARPLRAALVGEVRILLLICLYRVNTLKRSLIPPLSLHLRGDSFALENVIFSVDMPLLAVLFKGVSFIRRRF